MTNHTIELSEFDDFHITQIIASASTKKDRRKQLILVATPVLDKFYYATWLGDDIVYEGNVFEDAIQSYNEA